MSKKFERVATIILGVVMALVVAWVINSWGEVVLGNTMPDREPVSRYNAFAMLIEVGDAR